MQKAIEETGRIFQYGTQQRSIPHCWNGCELVRPGAIGKLRRSRSTLPTQLGRIDRRGPDPQASTSTWCGPARGRTLRTSANARHLLGLRLLDQIPGRLGRYPLDIMVWGSDADLSGPVVVEAPA